MATKQCRKFGKSFVTKTSTKICDECKVEEEYETKEQRRKVSYLLKNLEKGQELLKDRVSPCRKYEPSNLTCIRCRENGEEKYRGCFKK